MKRVCLILSLYCELVMTSGASMLKHLNRDSTIILNDSEFSLERCRQRIRDFGVLYLKAFNLIIQFLDRIAGCVCNVNKYCGSYV